MIEGSPSYCLTIRINCELDQYQTQQTEQKAQFFASPILITFRLIKGKPCPGAGGLAGLGPFELFLVEGEATGDGFRLKGFSLHDDWPGGKGRAK